MVVQIKMELPAYVIAAEILALAVQSVAMEILTDEWFIYSKKYQVFY